MANSYMITPDASPDSSQLSERADLVAVVILTLNQRDLTLGMLETLYASPTETTRVLVWDNGSTDGTTDAVAEAFPEASTHLSDRNLGVASGRNAGARTAIERWNPRYLAFLDNDLELESGFLDALRRVLDEDPSVGQVQGKLRFMHDRVRLNDGGGCRINFLTGETMPVGYAEIDRGQHDRVAPCIACGGAMMVRAELFERLDGFDTAFDPFGPEDLDFSLRLQGAGYRALYIPSATAYHLVNHTYGRGYDEEYARHKARHWLTFLGRHGTLVQKIGFYGLGAPYMVLRMAWREGRRGNLGALRGVLRGLIDKVTRS